MLCPGCRVDMQRLTVQATLGTTVDVESCGRCRAFWFEPFETIHLAPASTLQLFRLIAEETKVNAAHPFPSACYCPKCDSQLLLTHDFQRATRFQYWRCDHGHGRFTPYIDFLREKDFIHSLTQAQLTELRQTIHTVNCSNCGAAVDLANESVCSHCGAPLSILDIGKLSDVAQQLPQPAAPPHPDLTREHLAVAALMSLQSAKHDEHPLSLIEMGLDAVAGWLHDLTE